MGSKTDYFENKLTDVLWRGQSLTVGANTLTWSPAAPTYYVALFTVLPTDSIAGTEVTGGGYARQALTASLANMAGTQSTGSTVASTGTGATTSNNTPVSFGTASADLGTIVGFGIFDASTGGNLLEYAALTNSRNVTNGTSYSFAAGALTITEDS